MKTESFYFFCYENFMFPKMTNNGNFFAVSKKMLGAVMMALQNVVNSSQ